MACPAPGVRCRLLVGGGGCRLSAPPGDGGVRSSGEAQGWPDPSGRLQAREGRTGELLEPSLMPRNTSLARWDVGAG